MEKLLVFLRSYAYDSSSKKPLRSTLWMTFIISFIIILLAELPSMMDMNELGLLHGWINYRLERTHLLTSLIFYLLIFTLTRIILMFLQYIPDVYKKAKEEHERNNS